MCHLLGLFDNSLFVAEIAQSHGLAESLSDWILVGFEALYSDTPALLRPIRSPNYRYIESQFMVCISSCEYLLESRISCHQSFRGRKKVVLLEALGSVRPNTTE